MAGLCERERIKFVLGHALYMRAIHGGKAKNDKIDAYKIALLLKGGTFPQAYVYPAPLRATRDLMRRRNYLMRKRAELLAHIQNTNSQYNLPLFGARISKPHERRELLEHFPDAQVRKTIEVDVGLIDYYDRVLPALQRHIESSAQGHDPIVLALLRSVPGIGKTDNAALESLFSTLKIEQSEPRAACQRYCLSLDGSTLSSVLEGML